MLDRRLALILAACAAIYLPVLWADFVYDDWWTIVQNPAIQRFAPWRYFIEPQTFATPQSELSIGNFRPLAILSLALNHLIVGLKPSLYHLENLAWHLLNGWLVFLLLRRWVVKPEAAIFGAALFLAHPAQVETVAWVTQRSNLLCCAAVLGCLLLLSGRIGRVRLGMSWLCYALALFSKEQALILIPALLLIDWASLTSSQWRSRNRVYGGLAVVTVAYAAARTALGHPWSLAAGQTTWQSNLYLTFLSFPLYLVKLLIPMNLRVSYDYPPFNAWLIAGGAIFWLCYLCLAAATAALRHRWETAALLWIPLTLAPVLHFRPFLLFVGERFLYMPMIGLALGGALLYAHRSSWRPALRFWPVTLGIATMLVVAHWKNERNLWAAAVAAEPTNAFAHMNYARTLSNPDAAESHYKQALINDPSDAVRFGATNNLSWLYLNRGDARRALIWAQRARALDPKHPVALFNTARAHWALDQKREARKTFAELRALAPASSGLVKRLESEIDSAP